MTQPCHTGPAAHVCGACADSTPAPADVPDSPNPADTEAE